MRSQVKSVRYGPWLVALGAALWGTESLWRIPLNRMLASDVIVFYEHVILVLVSRRWWWWQYQLLQSRHGGCW